MQKQNSQQVVVPPKIYELFNEKARYRLCYGGRGSGKTRSFAMMSAVKGMQLAEAGVHGTILCVREFMNSLAESSFQEIKTVIETTPYLDEYYECGDRYIKTKNGRITYSFAGLRRNLDSIKSKSRILIAWADEAEQISDVAWMKLIPSVREENEFFGSSEIWVTWNPENKWSATHQRFRENPPRGSKLCQMNYKDNPFFPKVLNQERLSDKENRPELYDHIWEGDFLTFSEGSYYGVEMRKMREEERIKEVRYNPAVGVITSWDLGIGDSTSITFAQFIATEVHIIDYYEASGVGLDHYVKVLQDKGYVYDKHILPHDVRVKELGTGMSRLETLANLGIREVEIAPMLAIDDGIQAVRSMLTRTWMDKEKTDKLIDCLVNYSRDYDDTNKVFRLRPRHDWASHGADSMRYLAIGYRPNTSDWSEPIRRNLAGVV